MSNIKIDETELCTVSPSTADFRKRMSLDDWLEHVQVDSPGMWDNTTGPLDWYAVSDPDMGIIAYFAKEVDAFRFRLDYINRQMNP